MPDEKNACTYLVGREQLYELLAPTRLPENGFLLNRDFEPWENPINLAVRKVRKFDLKYRDEPAKSIFRVAREHERAYSSPTEAPVWIVLTHPLYMFFAHSKYLDGEKEREALEHLENLSKLMTLERSIGDVNIVVLETLDHYAAATSLLLEHGLVDRVVFTNFDRGHPISDHDLDTPNGRIFYMGGAYNKICFTQSLETLWEIVRDPLKIFLIPDLILGSSFHTSLRVPEDAIVWPYDTREDQKQVVTLADLYGIEGLRKIP